MRLRIQCKSCGLPFKEKLQPGATQIRCPNCGQTLPVLADVWTDDPPAVEACPVCGCRHLYRQRDFNRALGCALVLVGAALVPWTYGLSLVILSLIDLALYFRLRQTVVCYRCDTVYRDAEPGPRQKEFDLLKHDVLKYGKSWDRPADLEAEDSPTDGAAGDSR
jgi:transcription elongation factor Elf1